MIHLRNTQRESEGAVVKVNRKHQIALNVEVRRLEMEKKMRERYFSFEMSLVHARRLRIIERQKSLGIYRPHAIENMSKFAKKSTQVRKQAVPFFFTESVSMDTKFKLPPLSQEPHADSTFVTSFDGSSNLFTSNNFIFNKTTVGKDFVEHIRKSRNYGGAKGNNDYFPRPGEREFLEKQRIQLKELSLRTGNQATERKSRDEKTSDAKKDQRFVEKIAITDTVKKNEERVGGVGEQEASCLNDKGPVQRNCVETKARDELGEMTNARNGRKTSPQFHQSKLPSARKQSVGNNTDFTDMKSWKSTRDTARTKSSKGPRKDTEVNTIVRPHTAFAMMAASK